MRGQRGGGAEEELRAQLEDRTLQLSSVQRNYDGISRLMQVKQQELDQVRGGGGGSASIALAGLVAYGWLADWLAGFLDEVVMLLRFHDQRRNPACRRYWR